MRNLVRSAAYELRLARDLLRRRLYLSARSRKAVIDQFHRLYYDSAGLGQTWMDTRWLGVPTQKCPLDLWVYQEILFEQRPDVIIESGTCLGGSALFLASICDLLDHGRVITVDLEDKNVPVRHRRVTYLHGSSVSEEVVQQVAGSIGAAEKAMVILDSDHRKEHVLRELRIYSRYVTPGCYLIVEDTNLGGHPVAPEFGPGPAEAVQQFLDENRHFVVDRSREKFYLTFNPGGFLRRVQPDA
jgi:cephalosporin hydroxylase